MTNPYGQPGPSEYQHHPYGQPGYGPPSGGMPTQYPYGGPGYGGPGGDINAIPDYKGWAIATCFLFLILGILAIMKSNEVGTYKAQGNYLMAEQASRTTKTFCLIGSIIGGISCACVLVYVVVMVIAGIGVGLAGV